MVPDELNLCQANVDKGTCGECVFVLHRGILSQSKFLHKKSFLTMPDTEHTDGVKVPFSMLKS